jgi:hypothetical protein
MDGAQQGVARDANGRFLPGCSGNPAGKKPGTRNRATVLREALADGEDRKLARVVIDKALAGDAVTARFLLERLEPKPRGRTIELELPEGESAAGDVVALFNSALRAMAAGQITPAEAVDVSRFLEGRFRVLRAWQLEEKLTRWNKPLPVPGDDFVPDGTADRVKSPLRPTQSPAPSPATPTPPNTLMRGEENSGVEDEDLVIAVRDRMLTIPGVREVAQELGLLRTRSLHSACKSEAPQAPAEAPSESPPEPEES